MKKKSLISIVVVSVFLLSGIGFTGVDPEPFTPYINQLNALVNILNSALNRIEEVMGIEPEPFNPIGAVNRLEAIDNQLTLANGMVVSIGEEVMGVDPNPFSGDLELAFEDVQTAAQNIVVFINGIIDIPDPLISAIGDVKGSADAIVDTVDGYLDEVTCPPNIMPYFIEKLEKVRELVAQNNDPMPGTPINSVEACYTFQCSGFGPGSVLVIMPYPDMSDRLWIDCVKGYFDIGICNGGEPGAECDMAMTQRCYVSDWSDTSPSQTWRVGIDITDAQWEACRDDLLDAVN